MRRVFKCGRLLLLAAFIFSTNGCGTYMAHRLAQAPNTYPTWFAPKARVVLGFSPKVLAAFPRRFVEVGPPNAKLCYRVVPPAEFNLQISRTNWTEQGRRRSEFSFHARVAAPTNQWTSAPRGTVVLLHGYGLAQFAMTPWALRLCQEGWQCVLVDLRGHGKSNGRKIYYGLRETGDLSQLLDRLARDGQLPAPVSVMGESYGGALALRWKTVEPRVQSVVAIAPYAVLSNAVLNVARDYAPWVPKVFIRAGLKKLPSVLNAQPGELDMTTVLKKTPISALFVAGEDDKIMPAKELEALSKLAGRQSELFIVPQATHEEVTYYFKELAPLVLSWLEKTPGAGSAAEVPLPSAGTMSFTR